MTEAPRRPLRRGFSILELLIVMGIMMILIALTAGAAMRYSDVQRKKNTEWLLQKLDSALQQQWNAVIANANNEAIPPAVSTMASSNDQRARVIYIKLRLMQEFPMTFSEATNPAGGLLPPRPTYTAVLGGAKPPSDPATQSSICLYLALQQDRSGTKFSVDSALTNNEKKIDPTSGQTYIADQFGTSLAFFRWPYGNPEIVNANTNPVPATSSMQKGNNDPQDPQGLLSASGWSNVSQFTGLCHPVSTGQSYYGLMPCIASAGRNGKWGLNMTSMAVTTQKDAMDNLYSYRMRSGGKGD